MAAPGFVTVPTTAVHRLDAVLLGRCSSLLPASGPNLDLMIKGSNEEQLQTALGLGAKACAFALSSPSCGPAPRALK